MNLLQKKRKAEYLSYVNSNVVTRQIKRPLGLSHGTFPSTQKGSKASTFLTPSLSDVLSQFQ